LSFFYELLPILIRYAIREPAAEFLGTMIFVIFGTGVDCQVFLSIDPNVEAVPRGVNGSDIACVLYLHFMISQCRIFFRSISAGPQVGHILVSRLTSNDISLTIRQASHLGFGPQVVFLEDT
jgi:hypothetical protein